MYAYRFLPHTADVSLLLEADSVEELYLAGLEGMNQILRADFCKKPPAPSLAREIQINSIDPTTLLIDFLSEVLTQAYLEKGLFCEMEILERKDTFIKALIKGCPVPYFEDDIKAVTYHDAEIKQRKDEKWETPIVFDL